MFQNHIDKRENEILKVTAERKKDVNGKHCLQQAVWQDSGINTLTIK